MCRVLGSSIGLATAWQRFYEIEEKSSGGTHMYDFHSRSGGCQQDVHIVHKGWGKIFLDVTQGNPLSRLKTTTSLLVRSFVRCVCMGIEIESMQRILISCYEEEEA